MKCKKHPKYLGKRKPTSGCETCIEIWKNKNPIEKYRGQDKIKSKPIRLNRYEMKVKPGKDYAEMVFWGDVHLGHPKCQEKDAKDMLEHCLQKNIPVLLMGDLIESGTRESVGSGVYEQLINPQVQMEQMIEWLTPLAEKNLIIGLHQGNHENRITNMTGIDVSKVMARILKVPYLGYACWNLIKVGKQNYTVYSNHGSSGSRFKHTKMKAVMDLTGWLDADCIAMGHVHSVASEAMIKQQVDMRNKTVVEKKCYVVLTGSYISWDGTYAQMKNFPITKLGSPKAKLFADRKEIYFSF